MFLKINYTLPNNKNYTLDFGKINEITGTHTRDPENFLYLLRKLIKYNYDRIYGCDMAIMYELNDKKYSITVGKNGNACQKDIDRFNEFLKGVVYVDEHKFNNLMGKDLHKLAFTYRKEINNIFKKMKNPIRITEKGYLIDGIEEFMTDFETIKMLRFMLMILTNKDAKVFLVESYFNSINDDYVRIIVQQLIVYNPNVKQLIFSVNKCISNPNSESLQSSAIGFESSISLFPKDEYEYIFIRKDNGKFYFVRQTYNGSWLKDINYKTIKKNNNK